MRKFVLAAAATASFSVGALAASVPGLEQWAGRYSRSFMSGLVDGTRFRATDEVEIRPVDAISADVALSLTFFNGHTCWIEGRAKLEGRRLVLNQPEYTNYEGKPCRLELWRERGKLRWSDGENTCKDGCGARGTFTVGSVPLRSRRPLPAKTLEPM
jgi:hypothetical protein